LILDAVPLPIFVVDQDVRVLDCNSAAARLLAAEGGRYHNRRGGEVLNCVHAQDTPEGCGHGPACQDCVIRNSVGAAFAGNGVVRKRADVQLVRGESRLEMRLLITAAPVELEGVRRVLLTIEDIGEMVELRALLPICARCKKIRDDQDYWHRLEAYFGDRFDLEFTHGICPECAAELFPGLKPSAGIHGDTTFL
jgi:hypothetical protein